MSKPIDLTTARLKRWPLPIADEPDKDGRGQVLVVGGAPELPGAVMLAATSALRAGAGKLQIATVESIAQIIATQIPEALVMCLPETRGGAFTKSAVRKIISPAQEADAVLIGPGLVGGRLVENLVSAVIPKIKKATVVLDAEALKSFRTKPDWLVSARFGVIATPHAGEMANMLGITKAAVQKDALKLAHEFARISGVITVLKGAETFIVAPDGRAFRNTHGNIGLATSGSGDCLAGIIAGIAARGADALQAAVWGVFLHARAGEALAKKIGPIGYLAREIPAEIPAILAECTSGRAKTTSRRR